MNESKTFIFESYNYSKTYYDIHEDGITYRPDSDEKFNLAWEDIEYIEDRSGDRVVICSYDTKEVPISYSTIEFPIFLKTICLQLSRFRKDNFRPQKFTLQIQYLFQLSIAVLLLVLSLIISISFSNVLFFSFLTLSIPLVIFFQRQPISLTVDEDSLIFHHVSKETAIKYNEILSIDFEVSDNDYGRTLCIVINLKNKKKITIKKFDDLIVFFIMLQIKLNENIKVC